MKKYKCPCCGYYTLEHEEPLYHDICPVCYWESDPIQNIDVDFFGGANRFSLNEAKIAYEKWGAVSKDFIKYVRKPYLDEY